MAATGPFAFEVSRDSATLYVSGSLTMERVRQALAACAQLPEHVRRLRVDLRAVCLAEASTIAAFAQGLGPWRDAREASTRMDFPGAPVSFEVLDFSPRELPVAS